MMKTIKTIFGVLGVQPLGEWGALKSKIEGRGKTFPLIATLLLTLTLHAEVICIWDGNGYTCSGSGTQVNVIGGGELAPVVTNGVGVCTNCAAIPPDRLCQLADAIEGEATEIEQLLSVLATDLGETREAIETQLFEIGTYRSFATDLQSQQQATNYLHTVDNGQTRAVNAAMPNVTNGVNLAAAYRGATVHALNSVYNYASYTVEPKLEEYIGNLQYIEDIELPRISTAAQYIESELVPELREGCTACNSGSGVGGGPGGGSSTNQTSTGDWCTYEQGEAIKSLLRDLSNHVSRCHSVLVGISNNVAIVNQSIKDAIYAPYNAIPEYAGLGGQTWQDVYLQGADTPWGYESTNYLARIELLLYGLSGVGTNSTFMGEDEDFSQADQNLNALKNSLGGIRSDADGTQAETLGQAIVNFFNAFTPTTKALDDGDELLPEIPFSLGGQEYMVPGINATGRNVQLYNTLQPFVRGTCTALYCLIGALSVFFYWRWFAEKCVAFSKWAIELVGTLFYQ